MPVANLSAQLDDYRWLVSDEGGRWLAQVAQDPRPLVLQAERLRQELSAARVHLVLEQVELRRRAREKFLDADRMFFTRLGLEQATDQFVAAYKASRFPLGPTVADLCCGIGGDLLGLAHRGPVIGVDRDPLTGVLAAANARLVQPPDGLGPRAEVRAADVADFPLDQAAAWHLDPDRRPQGRRTTHVELHEPGLPLIERLLAISPNAAIKLAPASELPQAWCERAELEWISRQRQCRQLVAWFGSLASEPGRRRAAMVTSSPSGPPCLRALLGDPSARPPSVDQVGRYVFEPDAAVLAAKLVGTLADEHALASLGSVLGYLTGDRPVADPALACFEVTDVLPLDLRRLKTLLRDRGIGQLEIKKRAVPQEPEELRRRLALRGDGSAVLLITPIGGSTTAILARRIVTSPFPPTRPTG
jgi:hypothetical protein